MLTRLTLTLPLWLSSPALGVDLENDSATRSACSEEATASSRFIAYLFDKGDWTGARTEALRVLYAPAGEGSHEVAKFWLASVHGHRQEWDEALGYLSQLSILESGWSSLAVMERARQWGVRDPHVGLLLFQEFSPAEKSADWTEYSKRSSLHLAMSGGNLTVARELAERSFTEGSTRFIEGLDEARWRRPWAGAALSAILPGAGQAWSGRWGEASSALLVNGLFGWALWHNVRKGNDSAAVIIGVFGAGFYGGNVYGGAEAAVRRNRAQREELMIVLREELPIPPRPLPCDSRD